MGLVFGWGGWGGRRFGKRGLLNRRIVITRHFFDAFDLPAGNGRIGIGLAEFGQQPIAQAAQHAGGVFVGGFAKFHNPGFVGGKFNRAQPFYCRSVRTQKADMAQVIAIGYRVIGVAGRPE